MICPIEIEPSVKTGQVIIDVINVPTSLVVLDELSDFDRCMSAVENSRSVWIKVQSV